MRRLAVCLLALLLGGWAAPEPKPGALELAGDFVQGGLVQGRVPPGSEVRFAGRELRVTPDGRFVIGFGRDSDPRATLRVRYPDGRTGAHVIEIEERSYEVQRIDGLPERKVTPSAEDLERIRADARRINTAKRRDSSALGFAEPPVWPVTGTITGVFGSRRILNGEPRAPHRGVDVAAPEGTPVAAMASGLVSLAATGMYFTGGTVMIDHGHGLHSIYVHLAEVDVEAGQWLERGDAIGTVGATGRATGPHLHWGVYWFERALDPALLVGPMGASRARREP